MSKTEEDPDAKWAQKVWGFMSQEEKEAIIAVKYLMSNCLKVSKIIGADKYKELLAAVIDDSLPKAK